jgi:hypothetical protein
MTIGVIYLLRSRLKRGDFDFLDFHFCGALLSDGMDSQS